MKRLIGLACAFSLVLATSAPAQISSYSGAAGGTGTVAFSANLVVKKGKCKRRNRHGRCVKRGPGKKVVTSVQPGMKFSHLPITCDDGAHTLTLTKVSATPVTNGHFSNTGTGPGGSTITLTGQFSANGSSATGTVRDSGNISTLTGCDTGTLSWSAS